MVSREIDPRFWHEGGQSRNEIHRIEGHLGCPVPIRRRYQPLVNVRFKAAAAAFDNAVESPLLADYKDLMLPGFN